MTPYRRAPAGPAAAPRVPLRWVPRDAPLPVLGVAARGEAARAMTARLLALDDRELARWSGVGADEDIVVVGHDAPWVDGAQWLGRDPEAPAWLAPTAVRTEVPLPLVLRALAGAGVVASAPHAAWPTGDGLRVVPLVTARPLSRARLAAWVGALR